MKKTRARKQVRRKANKRKEERIVASLPVAQAKGNGMTRDASITGIFFEIDASYEQGSTIDFIVKLDDSAARHQLRRLLMYQGEIVRVEQHGNKVGVAVKITDSNLRYVQD